MKKVYFLIALFGISSVIIWFLIGRNTGPISTGNDPPSNDNQLVKMVDSVKSSNWQDNRQFKRVRSSILLSEANKYIDASKKNNLINTLDIYYGVSLVRKYDAIKFNFSNFPTDLYKEMILFRSKNASLGQGVIELQAYLTLESLKSVVIQFTNGRYNDATFKNLNARIDRIELGALSSNSNCNGLKTKYKKDLNNFKSEIEIVAKMIDILESDQPQRKRFLEYEALADYKDVTFNYLFYVNWFKNEDNVNSIAN